MHAQAPVPRLRLLGRYDYPTSYRMFEVVSLVVFVIFGGFFARKLGHELTDRLNGGVAIGVIAVMLLAYATADFLTGLVHFLCDNLGSPDTPIVGQKFIKSFRDHHDTPKAMTLDGFVAVNADNFAVCLPVLIPAALWLDVSRHLYAAAYLGVLLVFIVITTEAHKWAHMDRPPRVARLLQATLLLAPANHAVHHADPFDKNYCITSGMLNPLLTRLHFWPTLLRLLRRPS